MVGLITVSPSSPTRPMRSSPRSVSTSHGMVLGWSRSRSTTFSTPLATLSQWMRTVRLSHSESSLTSTVSALTVFLGMSTG